MAGGVSEIEFFAWLGALVGPLIAYGIWMQVKLMGSKEGEKFLQDRALAQSGTKRRNKAFGEGQAEIAGKAAKLGIGLEAAKGAYGEEVSSMIGDAWVFFKYYAVYAVVVLTAMFYFL